VGRELQRDAQPHATQLGVRERERERERERSTVRCSTTCDTASGKTPSPPSSSSPHTPLHRLTLIDHYGFREVESKWHHQQMARLPSGSTDKEEEFY
jgi:hypothetical protein